MSAAYATQADFEAYVEGWVTDDAAALGRLLERASDDLDQVLGDYPLYESGTWAGRKIDPTADTDYTQTRALKRATCAQAEYRNEMGEDHFLRPRFRNVTGPEFSTDGLPPIVGPKALRELSGTGLIRNTIALGQQKRWPRWLSFARNLDFD